MEELNEINTTPQVASSQFFFKFSYLSVSLKRSQGVNKRSKLTQISNTSFPTHQENGKRVACRSCSPDTFVCFPGSHFFSGVILRASDNWASAFLQPNRSLHVEWSVTWLLLEQCDRGKNSFTETCFNSVTKCQMAMPLFFTYEKY